MTFRVTSATTPHASVFTRKAARKRHAAVSYGAQVTVSMA